MKYTPLAGVDRTVAQTLRLGMDSGTFLQLEYVYGFERFGAYETWRGGWRVTDPKVMDFRHNRQGKFPLTVEHERMDGAIAAWVKAREDSEEKRKAAAEVSA